MKKILAILALVSITITYTKQTVLITGGAGYIGSCISLLLAQKGYEVIIVDNQIARHFDWATCIQGDFADQEILRDIFTSYKIEAVFHCAAHTVIGESIKDPLLYYENNVAKTISLLKTMHEFGVKKFIFSSSVCVYGDPVCIPIKEEDQKNPTNPYGQTKLMVETILKDLAMAHQIDFVCLRYVNVAGALPEYGLGENHKPEVHLIPNLLRTVENNQIFEIIEGSATEDGTCIRNYIHVQDIAFANYLALEYLNRGGVSDIFNIGSETNVSVKQTIQQLEAMLGLSIQTFVSTIKPWFSAVLTVDYSKASDILLFKPTHSSLSHILNTAFEFEEMMRYSGMRIIQKMCNACEITF